MKQWMKAKGLKILDWFLDFLLFIVPILEVSEVIAVVPIEYLPYYMLAVLILRRTKRVLEDHLRGKDVSVDKVKTE
jgi:hypothetical protein